MQVGYTLLPSRCLKVVLPALHDKVVPTHVIVESESSADISDCPLPSSRRVVIKGRHCIDGIVSCLAINTSNKQVPNNPRAKGKQVCYLSNPMDFPNVTNSEKKRNTNTFDFTATVHESEESKILPDVEPPPDHLFTVNLEPDTFTDEKYELFHDYQQHVHNEGPSEISRAGFKRFLCSSPLERRTEPSGKKLGSYHHCYRLDGRLIAMAVLDLLPHAVSGVYFLYHRDFEKWSLGKLSALRETALALEGGYEYYYMGYYIHSCLKMRYKGTYKPQHVLDFESFEWSPLNDDMCKLMDERKYVSMSRERDAKTLQAATNGLSESIPDAGEGEDPDLKPNSTPSEKSPYPTPSYPIPVDAANSGLSLLELGMPGVLSHSQLKQQVDLDDVKISLGRGGVHCTTDIVSWHDGSETDSASIKGVIAEFAACLGPELLEGVVVDFGR
jgi:arginine-tRNA-protein transferase